MGKNCVIRTGKPDKTANSGKPIYTGEVIVTANGTFTKDVDMRENDVYLISFVKL